MSRTIRYIPPKAGRYSRYLRTPRYRHKLLAGEPLKQIVTDWDDKMISAWKEIPTKQS